jgi:hypothetical protein
MSAFATGSMLLTQRVGVPVTANNAEGLQATNISNASALQEKVRICKHRTGHDQASAPLSST